MHFRSYICRCMHFRSYVTQMCALHALSCADVCTSDHIYADVCTSDPISRSCVHFRTYMMQMCALPILYDADVCTSGPDSCSCVHFSAANGLQLGASALLADVLLLVPPLRLRHPSPLSLVECCGFFAAAPCPVSFVCAFRFPPCSKRPGNTRVSPSTT